jgi:hypothetical protein
MAKEKNSATEKFQQVSAVLMVILAWVSKGVNNKATIVGTRATRAE